MLRVNNKNNLVYSDYLSSCDNINKYYIDNIYLLPKINKIVIEFPLAEFIKNTNKVEISSDFQVKSFFLFYSYFGQLPYVNCNKQLKVKKFDALMKYNYSFKITLNNKLEVFNFLNTLFVEHDWNKLLVKSEGSLSKGGKKGLKFESKYVENIIYRYICLNKINDIVFNLNHLFVNMILQNLNIKINFFLLNRCKIDNSKDFFKNIPVFWGFK